MLAQSNLPSGNSLKFFGGAGIGSLVEASQRTSWSINNALCFGQNVSWPQGCNDINCTKPQLEDQAEFGNVAIRFFGEGFASFDIEALGEMSVTMLGEGTTDFNAELGLERTVLMLGDGSFNADLEALGEMSISMDAGVRPSAFDIAQEIWQSQKTSYNSPGTMGNALNNASSGGVDYNALAAAVWQYVMEAGVTAEQAMRIYGAVLAGKVSGAGTGTEVFTGMDGTTVRVTSTVDASGNRTAVVVDGT